MRRRAIRRGPFFLIFTLENQREVGVVNVFRPPMATKHRCGTRGPGNVFQEKYD